MREKRRVDKDTTTRRTGVSEDRKLRQQRKRTEEVKKRGSSGQ